MKSKGYSVEFYKELILFDKIMDFCSKKVPKLLKISVFYYKSLILFDKIAKKHHGFKAFIRALLELY